METFCRTIITDSAPATGSRLDLDEEGAGNALPETHGRSQTPTKNVVRADAKASPGLRLVVLSGSQEFSRGLSLPPVSFTTPSW